MESENRMNNRRLNKRKQVQFLVVLTILTWATQTLLHQWGYGQEVTQSDQATQAADLPGDLKFVPSDSLSTPTGNLELRREATVSGADVTLKQVCRWSDSDAAVFTPIADLTLVHLPNQVSFRTITIEDIRQTLHDSGINIASINFSGASSCDISRSDPQANSPESVGQWLDSQHPPSAAPPAAPQPSVTPTAAPDPTFHTLRELLTTDLSQRLNIDPQMLQLTFSPQDDRVLSLAEPLFKFDLHPSRSRELGNISWDVTLFANSSSKKIRINAVARQWENQVIVGQPVAAHQILAPADFATHRVLVDSMPDRQLLRMDQCVGEQAAQELRPGVVMTSLLVDPVPMVRSGQLVTVTLTRGTVQLRSVARAMEQGTRGQTIRVRNENSRDVLYVVVTGPQEARMDAAADTGTSISQAN
jgi:flagella basal body P-ring formation protein FlgA